MTVVLASREIGYPVVTTARELGEVTYRKKGVQNARNICCLADSLRFQTFPPVTNRSLLFVGGGSKLGGTIFGDILAARNTRQKT